MVAQHARDGGEGQAPGRLVAADQRQLEDELVEAVGALEVPQRAAAEQRAERRLDGGAQAGRRGRRVADVDAPARQGRRDVLAELGVEVGGGEVGRLEDAVHEGADLDAGRHLGEQRRHAAHRRRLQVVVERAARGPAARTIVSSSSTTRSSGSLATRAS